MTVTPVFEAVTGRMLEPKAGTAGAFVSAGDLAGGAAMVNGSPPPHRSRHEPKRSAFRCSTGSAGTLLESLEAGASGAILGFAACAPQACQEVYLAWKDHDLKLAEEKQQRIAAASQRIVGQLGIAGVKYACDFNGYYGGRARAPLLALTAEERAEVEGLLAGIRN